ncbi:PIN domain-containing protein [Prevotella sp. PINT]|jgi:PIN domain.|uniref:type II toxin-antitoxin system VapC family toxin n=1 Tax=Palleniella intestinalis TaxID=2736291 RepID=UPI0015544F5A|nr:PIN domain-containing protein [Palleniella intestinalis]NPD81549.1 PIN domain-containing protein [Palleniella intestinalis]
MGKFRLFLDTNVILDLLLKREGSDHVKTILRSFGKSDCVISVSTIYTTSFYLERYLKKNGIFGDNKVSAIRTILTNILDTMTVAGIDETALRNGINDMAFNDLEDSFQLQTALKCNCNFLVTNNIKNFEKTDSITVISPQNFVDLMLKAK